MLATASSWSVTVRVSIRRGPTGGHPWFTSQGGPRDGRASGSVCGAGRAQGHRDGGGAPPDGERLRSRAGGAPVPHFHRRAARVARLGGRRVGDPGGDGGGAVVMGAGLACARGRGRL